MDSLRAATQGRTTKSVAIVVRSRFQKPLLLRRTLESVAAFGAEAGDAINFIPIIVTDKLDACPDFVHRQAKVLSAEFSGYSDTRNKLIEFAAHTVDADYFWFVDDDYWLFPNEAERIGLILNAAPTNTILFMDTQHFAEEISNSGSAVGRGYSIQAGRRFLAADWFKSLSDHNHVPFCGFICSRDLLLEIPQAIYDRVVYYEDFAVLLYALRALKQAPIVTSKLVAGISVRRSGNSITEADRSKWNKSIAEIASAICVDQGSPGFFSIPNQGQIPHFVQPTTTSPVQPMTELVPFTTDLVQGGTEFVQPRADLSSTERLAIVGIRLVKGMSRAAFAPSRWSMRIGLAKKVLANEGLGSLLKHVAMFRASSPLRWRHPQAIRKENTPRAKACRQSGGFTELGQLFGKRATSAVQGRCLQGMSASRSLFGHPEAMRSRVSFIHA